VIPKEVPAEQRYPNFTLTVKTESASWRDPDDCDWQVKLSCREGGPCLTGRDIPFSNRKPRRFTFRVTWDWAFGIMDELREMKIPAVPSFEMGCDGGFIELWSGGYDGKAHYRWWGGAPSGWEELDRLAWRFLETFRLLTLDSSPEKDRQSSRLLMECPVVGMSHVEDIHRKIAGLEVGSEVSLEREPENPHDSNAIAVLNDEDERIGYLPRGQNEGVARLLDHGWAIRAAVMDVGALNPRCPIMKVTLVLKVPVLADDGLLEVAD